MHIVYSNMTLIRYGLIKNGSVMGVDSIFCPGEKVTVMICWVVDSSANTVSSSTLTVSNLNADFVFTQGDINICPI